MDNKTPVNNIPLTSKQINWLKRTLSDEKRYVPTDDEIQSVALECRKCETKVYPSGRTKWSTNMGHLKELVKRYTGPKID